MNRFFAPVMIIICVTLLVALPDTHASAQPDSLLYLSVVSKGYVVLSANTGQEKFDLPALKDKSVVFSPNRNHFYVNEDTHITVYESHTGQISKTIQLDQPISKDMPGCNFPRSPYISSDERWYYGIYSYGCNDIREDILRVVDLEHGKVIPEWIDLRDFCGIGHEVNNVVLLQCGHGFFDFDLTTRKFESSYINFAAQGPTLGWSWFIVSNQSGYLWKDGSKVSAWDMKTANPLWQIEIPLLKTDLLWMRITPDYSKLILTYADFGEDRNRTNFRILNTSDGNRIAVFDVDYSFLNLDTSWDGSVLYGLVKMKSGTESISDTFVAIDAFTGQTMYKVQRADQKFQAIIFVP